jgi:hypothetical protein
VVPLRWYRTNASNIGTEGLECEHLCICYLYFVLNKGYQRGCHYTLLSFGACMIIFVSNPLPKTFPLHFATLSQNAILPPRLSTLPSNSTNVNSSLSFHVTESNSWKLLLMVTTFSPAFSVGATAKRHTVSKHKVVMPPCNVRAGVMTCGARGNVAIAVGIVDGEDGVG